MWHPSHSYWHQPDRANGYYRFVDGYWPEPRLPLKFLVTCTKFIVPLPHRGLLGVVGSNCSVSPLAPSPSMVVSRHGRASCGRVRVGTILSLCVPDTSNSALLNRKATIVTFHNCDDDIAEPLQG